MWARMQYDRWEDESNVNEQHQQHLEDQIETEGREEKTGTDLDKSDKKVKKKMSNVVEQTSQQDLTEKKITAA